MLIELEKKFNVIYPDNENATYDSILNYSTEKDSPFQRWYRYKEGFSIQFIDKIIEEYSDGNIKKLLDPFCGSGTTILAANKHGCQGIGFEVNPFSFFLTKIKQDYYSLEEVDVFKNEYEQIISSLVKYELENYTLPKLSISGKVFQDEAEKVMMSCKVKIDSVENVKVRNLLLLGWLASIEELSDYRKAGNGLKKRKTVKPIYVKKDDVINRLQLQYKQMYVDLVNRTNSKVENFLFNRSCLDFADIIQHESIDGIIFSPPYANCFDYTEIYKLELWFGEFVKEYADLKVLRNKSLKSHLNIKYSQDEEAILESDVLVDRINRIKQSELWDKRIPMMLSGYFKDMYNVIDSAYKTLRPGGFCAIVVGNSAYSGVVVPTDLILAEYAERIGFCVDKIEVDRFIITSSQQYEKTKHDGKFLRESVICLIKK
ncbi:DNA methyltransferase [Clostridium beijerinckii]|uniref:DNA methyltransferase n=1 Tax=Clostridium beijerinckii TaxID=1520 RepID=UPI000809F447|nr:DNA methyltransferase [Clostridium beijerinckii]OCA97838.1 modification methylase [Clostridium beijerinckii]